MRLLIILALVGAALAFPKTTNRIVGGSDTTVEKYPYMSAMEYNLWGIWWVQGCGGSLITSNAVLSAAHCFEGDRASDWRVRVGSSRVQTGGFTHLISQLVLHEQYDSLSAEPDVAIAKLSTPVVYSPSVAAARLAGGNYNIPDGTTVTAVGWGALWSGGPSPSILQHVDVNIINQKLCAERYAYLKTQPFYENWPDITNNMICAGILDVGGKDACQGDSGGPLAYDGDILVGITSWGFGCAHEFYPGVNTRVSALIDWIIANAV